MLPVCSGTLFHNKATGSPDGFFLPKSNERYGLKKESYNVGYGVGLVLLNLGICNEIFTN